MEIESVGVVWFKRDLRVDDHLPLLIRFIHCHHAMKYSPTSFCQKILRHSHPTSKDGGFPANCRNV